MFRKRKTTQREPEVPDVHSEPQMPHPRPDETTARIQVAEVLPEPGADDSGVEARETCPHCHGTGRKLTTADYLGEIVGMLPADDPAAMDAVIAQFYGGLIQAAPHLAEFFPPDLTTGDALNSRGNRQRDQLLAALVALLTRYDPDHPQSTNMRGLRTSAQTWGRSHAHWRRPSDGSVYVPTEEDYLTVRNVLAHLLASALGSALKPAHMDALVRAYRSVSLWMQQSADEWRMEQGEPVIARRPRPEATR